MIIHDGEVLRNLQEQVEKNKDDILYILEERGVLNQFGIRVMAVVKTVADIPTVDEYKSDNPEWSYGDCYMVGEAEPYIMYILTRANGTILTDYWLNIGQFPLAGPKGDKGDNGIGIDTMQVINFPSGNHSATYNTTDGTMVHGTMDLTYMDGDSSVTKNVSNVTMDIPITYGDGLKAEATATNDKVEVKVDGKKVMKMPELDQQNLYLGVAVGKWSSGTSSTKAPDAIQWRDFQKNVKNNAMVQRTETGNVLLPEGFPADVGGGVDQYGNVIDNMAVTKGYVDSHTGGGGLGNNCLHTIQINKATSAKDSATSPYYFTGVIEFLNGKDGRYSPMSGNDNFDYILERSAVIYASGKMYNNDGTLYGEVIGVYPPSSNPMIMRADGTITVINFEWWSTDYDDRYKKLT